ncbi:BPH1 [Candida oxycetoniae]|uniref:BPH1 n=1 Tax=Candida oxycetoniae TaxID=497107 RepID=A0AAI9STD8_9ASCO|nr:BPH1 [Candida oxycetoniae]KAI3402675.2 BPH1 [Candida oxycetoniae]
MNNDEPVSSSEKDLIDKVINETECDLQSVLEWLRQTYPDNSALHIVALQQVQMALSQRSVLKIKNLSCLHILVCEFLKLVSGENYQVKVNEKEEEESKLVYQFRELIISLFAVGCDNKSFKMLFKALYAGSNALVKYAILKLLLHICANSTYYPFLVISHQVNFPFDNRIKDSFTIYFWFRLENIVDYDVPITIFTLASSDPSNKHTSTTFTLQIINAEQVVVEIRNIRTKSRSQFSFNYLVDAAAPDSLTQIALIYNKTTLSLFVNGQYSESMPCTELCHESINWNKISLGSNGPAGNNPDLIIRNITLLNSCLSAEWILVLFNFGPSYNWDFKDIEKESVKSLVNRLGNKELFETTKVLASFHQKRSNQASNQLYHHHRIRKGGRTSSPNGKKEADLQNKLTNKNFVVDSLSRIKEESVLYDSNDFLRHAMNRRGGKQQQQQQQQHLAKDILTKNLIVHFTYSMYQAIDAAGGVFVILEVLHQCANISDVKLRDSIMLLGLKLLFNILEHDWRLRIDFETFNGYSLLSMLLFKYKKVNPSLVFNPLENCTKSVNGDGDGDVALNSEGEEEKISVLDVLLSFSGFDMTNPYESAILNRDCYRFLILNFNLFYGSSCFEFLLYHIQSLLTSSKFREHNLSELYKMKLLKKLLHFLKMSNIRDSDLPKSWKEQLSQTLAAILTLDPSGEAILLVSSYVILALFNEESSTECGIIALQALTDYILDPQTPTKTLRKFTRSITIHWILLLFESDMEPVVNCGVMLLICLLRLLGPHVVKQFFSQNHGLEVLTSALKSWWRSDKILLSVFLGAYSSSSLDVAIRNQDQCHHHHHPHFLLHHPHHQRISTNEQLTNNITMREILLLSNNLVLNSMYELSSSSGKLMSNPPSPWNEHFNQEQSSLVYDVVRSIGQYITWLKDYGVVKKMFNVKDFMQGLVELLGYLKLSISWYGDGDVEASIKNLYERLISLICDDYYLFSLFSTQFLASVRDMSDFTRKVLFDLVIPEVFKQVNEKITDPNSVSVIDDKLFVNNISELLAMYNIEFLHEGYFVSLNSLRIYTLCLLSIVETGAVGAKLKQILGESVVTLSLRLARDAEVSNAKENNLTSFLRELLYRQLVVMRKDVLSNGQIAVLIKLLLGVLLAQGGNETDKTDLEATFSFLRTIYLIRQDDFPNIIGLLKCDVSLLSDFFINLTSKNDHETMLKLKKYPPFVKSILKGFQVLKQEDAEREFMYVTNMIRVTLHNGGKLGQMNSIYTKSFDKDCQTIQSQIVNAELVNYNRIEQDRKDNATHNAELFHTWKSNTSRLFFDDDYPEVDFVLDYIENDHRIRKRLVVEDLLADAEKLAYGSDVPLKEITHAVESHNEYDYAILSSNLNTLSLSTTTTANNGSSSQEDCGFRSDVPDHSSDPEEVQENTFEDRNRRVTRSLYVGDRIVSLWNVSQINGLIPIESLMILGDSHLYLIENYFHGEDGNVIDVSDAPTNMRDPILQLVNSQSRSNNEHKLTLHRSKSWSLKKLSAVSKRQFLLRDNAFEMFFSDGASVLVTCMSAKERNLIFSKLKALVTGQGISYELAQALSSNSTLVSEGSISSKLVSAFSNATSNNMSYLSATKKWKMGEISNLYYLMIINTLAGRTFNDLTQYPPMGAQTSQRAVQFKERYEALSSLNDENAPAFHYGTHYSSAMIVTSFLIRLKPFVHSFLLLQGGKFDHADRLFNSIEKAWISASRDNTTDVRELTPEFFYLPEFLKNSNHFDFGTLQNGQCVNDVELPPWAHNDPQIFIAKNREALESPYVSANLHSWIDLIFGYKQDGAEAVDALNVFHHYSYNGGIDLDHVENEVEKRAAIGMINNFGQTPKKVFFKPHIMREVLNLPNYYLTVLPQGKMPLLVFESKLNAPVVKLELSSTDRFRWVGRQSCVSCEDKLLIRKSERSNKGGGSLRVNDKLFIDIHPCDISTVLQVGNGTFLTGTESGLISVWEYITTPSISLVHRSTLRGHFSSITEVVFSKSFKIGVSIDEDGLAIVWDFARFTFIRRLIAAATDTIESSFIAISNDTGNIASIIKHKSCYSTVLRVFSMNGEEMLSHKLANIKGRTIIAFGTTDFPFHPGNPNHTNTGNNAYWSNELIAIAHQKSIEVFEVVSSSSWKLKLLQRIKLESISGEITALKLFKCSEVDSDDRLIRGVLKLVVGTSSGQVYTL